MISDQAMLALAELEAGARMNCIHTVSRELIAAGLAFDGWGKLEISEAGRRLLRQKVVRVELPHRNFVVEDPNISNMDAEPSRCKNPVARGESMGTAALTGDAPVAAVSTLQPPTDAELDAAEEELKQAALRDQIHRNAPTLAPAVKAMGLKWSRSRAIKAAGEANGRSGLWVDEKWVACFLDAYEAI